MVFSSPVFLFLFLPFLLALYLVGRVGWRNLLLLAASLFFYAWGEKEYVVVLLASIGVNYAFGLLIDRLPPGRKSRVALALAAALNLGLLAAFKYANFLADNLSPVSEAAGWGPLRLAPVHLPLGISFFTFHALSYVVDVYRREVRALTDPIRFALYISFFPQSIAGPIVRYHEIAGQLGDRPLHFDGFAEGVRRFVVGFAKKMLVANTLSVPVAAIFGLPAEELTAGLAWLAAACYTLQIYFDFGGYSDMAIGLAGMFGFTFPENFRYPYAATSVADFWRRWHISLSGWFRDYLYVPLGGNRRGPARTYFNLLLVFFLCGLWHGAQWSFVLWGLYHGAFLVAERVGLGRVLAASWRPLRHGYTLLVVVVGWVFFRAETFGQAAAFFRAMAGLAPPTSGLFPVALYLNNEVLLALAVGAVGSMPFVPWVARLTERWRGAAGGERWNPVPAAFEFAAAAGLVLLLIASVMQLAGGTHNPFIYSRF